MTVDEFTRVVTAGGVVMTSLLSAVGTILSLRNGRKIDVVHSITNSRLTELIEATRKGAFAEGVKHGADAP